MIESGQLLLDVGIPLLEVDLRREVDLVADENDRLVVLHAVGREVLVDLADLLADVEHVDADVGAPDALVAA